MQWSFKIKRKIELQPNLSTNNEYSCGFVLIEFLDKTRFQFQLISFSPFFLMEFNLIAGVRFFGKLINPINAHHCRREFDCCISLQEIIFFQCFTVNNFCRFSWPAFYFNIMNFFILHVYLIVLFINLAENDNKIPFTMTNSCPHNFSTKMISIWHYFGHILMLEAPFLNEK